MVACKDLGQGWQNHLAPSGRGLLSTMGHLAPFIINLLHSIMRTGIQTSLIRRISTPPPSPPLPFIPHKALLPPFIYTLPFPGWRAPTFSGIKASCAAKRGKTLPGFVLSQNSPRRMSRFFPPLDNVRIVECDIIILAVQPRHLYGLDRVEPEPE